MYLVVVAPSGSMASEVAGLFELAYQPVCRTLGEVDACSDVPKTDARLLRDADQDSSVLGEKRGHRRTVWLLLDEFK